MNTGRLQRKWSENEPATFDKETRMVCLDIQAETRTNEEGVEVNGYGYVEVQIDKVIDYGHIKSQLIEAAFAQKEEFAMLMNGVSDILDAIDSSDSWKAFKSAISTEALANFTAFCEYRAACGAAAKVVITYY